MFNLLPYQMQFLQWLNRSIYKYYYTWIDANKQIRLNWACFNQTNKLNWNRWECIKWPSIIIIIIILKNKSFHVYVLVLTKTQIFKCKPCKLLAVQRLLWYLSVRNLFIVSLLKEQMQTTTVVCKRVVHAHTQKDQILKINDAVQLK